MPVKLHPKPHLNTPDGTRGTPILGPICGLRGSHMGRLWVDCGSHMAQWTLSRVLLLELFTVTITPLLEYGLSA